LPGKQHVIILYQPLPDYSDEARKARLQGTVVVQLTVGVDGMAHDMHVVRPLGKGLDEKALESLATWQFAPAMEDGKPVESMITMEISFHMYK
jgi:TonB family protein